VAEIMKSAETTATQEGDAPVIDVRNLVKCFGALRAIDGISFQVERGETLGLLGPNGAGKTTTMRVLSGLSPVDGGTVHVAGIDAVRDGRAVRRLLGVVTQDDGLDEDVNVRQNLELFGFLAGLSRRVAAERTVEVLGFFSLSERAEDPSTSSRAGCAGAWRLRGRWFADRPSSCSTSRRPDSIRTAAPVSGRSWRSSSRAASRS
jgi:ABC-type uncharacterized transport system ATPase subunit